MMLNWVRLCVLLVPILLAGVSLPWIAHWESTASLNRQIGDAMEHKAIPNALRISTEIANSNEHDVTAHFTRGLVLTSGQDQYWLERIVGNQGTPNADQTRVLLTEAKREYQLALEADRLEDGCWHNLGWIEVELGNLDAAATDFSRAIQLEDQDYLYRVSYGLLLEARAQRAAAATQYGAAIGLNPRILSTRFYEELEARDKVLSTESISTAEQALLHVHTNPVYNARLAALRLRRNQLPQAEQEIRSSLELLPNMGGAWLTLAEIELWSGQLQNAEQSLQKAQYLLRERNELFQVVRDLNLAQPNLKPTDHQWDIAGLPMTPLSTQHSIRIRTQFTTVVPFMNDMVPASLLPYTTLVSKPNQINLKQVNPEPFRYLTQPSRVP